MSKKSIIIEAALLVVLIIGGVVLLQSCTPRESDGQAAGGAVAQESGNQNEPKEDLQTEQSAAEDPAKEASSSQKADETDSLASGDTSLPSEPQGSADTDSDSEDINMAISGDATPFEDIIPDGIQTVTVPERTALERTSDRYEDLMVRLLTEDESHKNDTLMSVEVVDLGNDLSYEYAVLFREPTELLREEIYNMNDDKPVLSLPVNRYNLYLASDPYGNNVASVEAKDGSVHIVNGTESKLYYAPSESTKADGYPLVIASEFMDRGRDELQHGKMPSGVLYDAPVELATNQDLAVISSIIMGNKREFAHDPLIVDVNEENAEAGPGSGWKNLFDMALKNYVRAAVENEKSFDDTE